MTDEPSRTEKLVDAREACIQIKRILHACLRPTYQSKSGSPSLSVGRSVGGSETRRTQTTDDNRDEMASGNRPATADVRPTQRIKGITCIYPHDRRPASTCHGAAIDQDWSQ